MSDVIDRLANLSPAKRQLMERLMRKETQAAEPVAVIGMSCRFPGAPNLDSYWRLIAEGIDATSEIPASRWDADAFYEPAGDSAGKMTTRWGGFVDNVDRFDPLFFGITPREAEKMDPQQRLLLEVAWEAFEHGGAAPDAYRGSATGVFVGIGGVDYSRIPVLYDDYFERINAHSGTGNALSIAANRLSYIFDLRGPSMAVDTACSSSLVAVHLAVRSLRSRECDAALAGGVNLILSPETTIAFSDARMLSPDGKCRPFDAAANGYVRGEGCGIIVLKRLADALSAGDRILAVIRGSAVNQDGRTSGITAPNGLSQQAVIRRALSDAALTVGDISYIEAHGTGTPLGDPIEGLALGELFPRRSPDDSPCMIGSVKANIGHTETSAAIASIIKVILMLGRAKIPGQTHLDALNPHISLDGTRLAIPRQSRRWETAGPRIAGVSAFGFGGTNGHVIIGQAPERERETNAVDRPIHLLPLSAKTDAALRELAADYDQFLEQSDDPLADICHTAAAGRSHFQNRAAILADSRQQLRQRLAELAAGGRQRGIVQGSVRPVKRTQVAFLFSGQGSQYAGMGRQLFDTQPLFRETLIECDQILRAHWDESLIDVLYGSGNQSLLLNETRYTQPALFSIEYALAVLWQSWGIRPAFVLGHSVGEYAAACVAKVFSLQEGLNLIAQRARLMQQLPRNGMMAVIFAAGSRLEQLLADRQDAVSIAAYNGPENTVISGQTNIVSQLMEECQSQGIRTQALNVSHAFHSPLMEPMLDEFERLAGQIEYRRPEIPIVSNLTGQILVDKAPDARYWREHVRSPVQFVRGMQRLETEDLDALVEIGPSTTLLGMGRRCLPASRCGWFPSLRAGREDWPVILETLGELYVRGTDVDWQAYDRPWSRRRLSLPTYPFQRSRHWYPPGTQRSKQIGTATPRTALHPLLGVALSTPLPQTLFETILSAASPEYLADHQVQGAPVVPAAAYIEQALAGAHFALGEGQHLVENVSIQQAMLLPRNVKRRVQVCVSPEDNGQCRFEIFSSGDSSESGKQDWVLHACGTIRRGREGGESSRPAFDIQAIRNRLGDARSRDAFYDDMASRELAYGPAFRVLDDLARNPAEGLATVTLPEQVVSQLHQYHLHPALLDACFQSMAAAVPLEVDGTFSPHTYVPTFAGRVRILSKLAGRMWTYVVRTSADNNPSPDTVEGDVLLLDESGKVLAEVLGIRVQRVSRSATRQAADKIGDWAYQVRWKSQESHAVGQVDKTEQAPFPMRWLVFSDDRGCGEALSGQLAQRGAHCTLVRPGDRFRRVEMDPSSSTPVIEIDPLADADYQQLLQQCMSDADGPWGIAHLWSLDVGTCQADGDGDLANARRISYGSALLLIGQLARMSGGNPSTLVFATRGAQAIQPDEALSVGQSALWGLGRVAMNEHPELHCRLIDLDPNAAPADSAMQLIEEGSALSDEWQIAYRTGQRFVARLEHAPETISSDQRSRNPEIPAGGSFRLEIESAGNLDALRYRATKRRQPDAGQVEIAVSNAGLNFSDILKALGLYPGITDEIVPLGIECSGVVTKVGEGVQRFRVGDQVMGVAPYSFASHAVTAEYALVAKPEHISAQEACTIPITFLTAYYALCRLAHLQPDEKVLIHAGAGGVGLAAIQIAQHVGAKIFATAGSDEKRNLLTSLGVQHVFNSRTTEFAEQILEITDRRGVDVVLNSLPGEAITKSLSILSAYGRFLEIGKTDIYQNRMIGLLPFQDNLSYSAIDLDRMLRQRPDYIRDLFAEVMEYFHRGIYQPLPLTHFTAERVVDAFRYMAQRKNVGKVVVSTQRPNNESQQGNESQQDNESQQNSRADSAAVRPGVTYLVTGGLGALGLQVAEWLTSQGATHLALMSRRAPSEDVAQVVARIGEQGAEIAVLKGDVSQQDSLHRALQQLPAEFPPLRGVIHAAGVLADGLMLDMDLDQLDAVMAPKMQGAWSLHKATLDMPLDFFVLFSSVASILGSPGQANYAAGNAFLDGLAHYRRSHGLTASSVNWGPWAGAGMVQQGGLQRQLASRGLAMLPVAAALETLGDVLRQGPASLAVVDAQWPRMIEQMRGRRPAFFESVADNADSGEASGQTQELDLEFCKKLREADAEERAALLCEYICNEVALVMGMEASELDIDQPLGTLGMDSLMGIELTAKVESQLGIDLPMAALVESPTVVSLAQLADQSFQAHIGVPGQQARDGSQDEATTDSGMSPSTTLVSLASGGPGVPLFCVHPVGGDVRCYFELSQRLGSRRAVYAFRAHGLEGLDPPDGTIEAMASHYLEQIRQVLPEGPYNLAGWSTGGIFAYEVARQLRMQGAEVGFLAFFDTPSPSIFQNVDLTDDARFLYDLVNFSNWFSDAQMRVSYSVLRSQEPEQALMTVLDEAKRHNVLPANATVDFLRRRVDICKVHVRAIMEYRPVACGQPVTLFRPTDTSALAEASGQTLSRNLGWGSVLGDLLSTVETSGDHFSMMTGDHIDRLGQRLQARLSDDGNGKSS